jgi:hypothetical protein
MSTNQSTLAAPGTKSCAACGEFSPARAAACQHCDTPFGRDQTLITSGVALALLFPIVGFIIGVILLLKSRVGPGLGVIALCPVGVMIGLILLYGV